MERVFDLDETLDRVRAALEAGNFPLAVAVLEDLRPADQAEVFAELDDDQQETLLPQMAEEDSADILEWLDDQDAADLAETLSDDDLVRIVEEMEPDEAADLLGDLPPERTNAILAQLEDPDEIRPLLVHPEDSAGGIMTSQFLALRRRMRVQDALEAVRTAELDDPRAATIYSLYVIDAIGTLAGLVSLYELLTAPPTARVMDVMNPDVISIAADADQEDAARLMTRYELLSLPVVDANHRLLGIITHSDLIEVIEEETTEDIQRLGGAQPLEGAYLSTSVLAIARSRAGWLLLLFITATLTGTVLRIFSAELEAVVALAFFIPLLIGTGGNAGSQTTNTIIRALAVGDISLRDSLWVVWHEFRTGIVLGTAMAAAGLLRAALWGTGGDVALAVGVGLLLVVVWANVVGALLPLLATRVHLDPALVSGPFTSTLVDATGLLIYLTTAKLILGI